MVTRSKEPITMKIKKNFNPDYKRWIWPGSGWYGEQDTFHNRVTHYLSGDIFNIDTILTLKRW